MNGLSKRYAIHVIVLAGVVGAMLWLNSGSTFARDDCADPAALRTARFDSAVDPWEDSRGSRGSLFQWTTGRLELDGRLAMRFSVIRSFYPLSLYSRPTRLRKNFEPDRARFERATSGDDVLPIHYLYSSTSRRHRMVAYFLAYRSRPVEKPFLAQLASLPSDLTGGRTPMTAFLISGRFPAAELPRAEQAAEQWLVQAWQTYRKACDG